MRNLTGQWPNGVARKPLDGPVIASIAEDSTPGIAASDCRWATTVLAGWAAGQHADAAELREALIMTGLIADDTPIRFGVRM